MKDGLSFQDILDIKLAGPKLFSSEKPPSEDFALGVEPKYLSSLFSLMNDKIPSGQKATLPKAYQKIAKTSAEPTKIIPFLVDVNRTKEPSKKSIKPRVPGPKHTLSALQKQSFGFFCSFGTSLLEDFNREELQLAYRHLALKFHPDRQDGSAKQFIELKTHYEILKKLLK